MTLNISDKDVYALQLRCVNDPLGFIAEASKPSRKPDGYPRELIELMMAKSLLISGSTTRGMDLLHRLERPIASMMNCMLSAKHKLFMYQALNLVNTDTAKAGELLRKARTISEQCGSKALLCECKISEALQQDNAMEWETREEILQSAMQDALEADIQGLQLDVHFSYAIAYLLGKLPEPAQRALSLFLEQLDKERYPYIYASSFIYQGIIHNMLKKHSQAEAVFGEGVLLCEQHSYAALSIPLLVNLGISKVSCGKADEGIEAYHKCIQLVAKYELQNSINAGKAHDNLALALGNTGREKEAVQIYRDSMEKALKAKDMQRVNILRVNLANILIELDEQQEALQLLDIAINDLTKSNETYYLTFAYRCKARAYESMENYEEAFNAMEMLDNVNRKYFQENFNHQHKVFQDRIEKLRSEYLLIKERCRVEECDTRIGVEHELIGEHPSVKKAIHEALMAARYPFINVLITGESGTGKEVLSRIIHAESKTGKPMVAINASAISPNLIESELFGHKRGAFTGALEDRKGKFLMADKGTLLLDEITDMPLECQAKLLRAIEANAIQPVGYDREVPVQCRVISTSNNDMQTLIRANKFRLDLFHRLNKVEIHLLPLRERLSDLELVTGHFVRRFSNSLRIPMPTLTESFYARLKDYSFPGNIRELMNIVERIFILNPSKQWKAEHLDGLIPDNNFSPKGELNLKQNIRDTEATAMINALEQCGWVQKEAAKLLNITESTLSRHMRKLGITRQ